LEYPEVLQERLRIPRRARRWSLLTDSGYTSMSNENVPSPRDNTL